MSALPERLRVGVLFGGDSPERPGPVAAGLSCDHLIRHIPATAFTNALTFRSRL